MKCALDTIRLYKFYTFAIFNCVKEINTVKERTAMKTLFSLMCVLALFWTFIPSTSQAQTIKFAHCPFGCPQKAEDNNTIVVREIYVLSNNPNTFFADWVAYRVTSSTIGTSKDYNRTWVSDNLLPEDETLEKNDYSGASDTLKTDRGHQVPLAAFAGTVYWRDTNILSNITPQKKSLNQGPWEALEEAVRELAFEKHELFVLSGTHYADPETNTRLPSSDEQAVLPDGYWKIIYDKRGHYAAFLFDQDTARSVRYCENKTTLETISQKAKFSFFQGSQMEFKAKLFDDFGC